MSEGDAERSGAWKRVTIRMPESMIEELDDVVDNGAAPNRSDAIRRCVANADLEWMFK